MTFLFSLFKIIRMAIKVVKVIATGIALIHGARKYAL